MTSTKVSMPQGRRDFNRLVREAFDQNRDVIITKRQEPGAAIISFDEYQRMQRLEGFRKIKAAREAFLKARVKAKGVYEESKRELEG
jgi:prevent-host-death family protein